jgi:uncharacterized protein (UPF0333 family)
MAELLVIPIMFEKNKRRVNMKSMWKRAQTATEYLIILAVVIIIALIVPFSTSISC